MSSHQDSDLYGNPAGPADAAPAQRHGIGAVTNSAVPPPATRTVGTVLRLGTAAAVLLALIIFVAQNTARTRIAFLGMDGSLPLAAALLAAAFAGALLAVVVGTTRATRLRRRAHRP
jgi:uncharacterized integral membrane protein